MKSRTIVPSQKMLAALAALAVACAAYSFFSLNKKMTVTRVSEPPNQTATLDLNDQKGNDTAIDPASSRQSPPQTPEIYSEVSHSRTYRQALQHLEGYAVSAEPAANDLKLMIVSLCAGVVQSKTTTANQDFLNLQSYCAGFDPGELGMPYRQWLAKILSGTTTVALRNEIEANKHQGSVVIEQILEKSIASNDPGVRREALMYSSEHGIMPGELGVRIRATGGAFNERIQMQLQTLGQIEYCRANSMCEAGSIETIAFCLTSSTCRPGENLLDASRRVTAPADWDAAVALSRESFLKGN